MIDEQFIKAQKKKIETLVKRLEEEIKTNKKYLDIGSSTDDSALEFEAFEEKQALLKSAQKDLKELKAALKRIDEGKYGICEVGGEQIEKGRLNAYLAATTCVTHAKKN